MVRRFHKYFRDELVRLAELAFPLPHERKNFIDTVADNLHYRTPDVDGCKVTRINEEVDLQKVEDLAARFSYKFSDVE